MENIVDFPFLRECEVDSQQGNDFLNLEGVMIFMIQLPQQSARFNVTSIEHHQVSYLVCWGFLSRWIGVSAYSLLCFFQALPRLVVHCVHPVCIHLAAWVERFHQRRVYSYRIEAIVSIEWRHTVS